MVCKVCLLAAAVVDDTDSLGSSRIEDRLETKLLVEMVIVSFVS